MNIYEPWWFSIVNSYFTRGYISCLFAIALERWHHESVHCRTPSQPWWWSSSTCVAWPQWSFSSKTPSITALLIQRASPVLIWCSFASRSWRGVSWSEVRVRTIRNKWNGFKNHLSGKLLAVWNSGWLSRPANFMKLLLCRSNNQVWPITLAPNLPTPLQLQNHKIVVPFVVPFVKRIILGDLQPVFVSSLKIGKPPTAQENVLDGRRPKQFCPFPCWMAHHSWPTMQL